MPGRQRRRSRKQKKRSQQRPQQRGLDPGRALAEALRSLDDGDPRKALELLRRVSRQDGAPAVPPVWLFCACVERARQLHRKGSAKEAAALRSRAVQHRAAIDVGTLAEEDLIRFLRCLEAGDAVAVYAGHLAVGPPLPAAERAVADRLVIDRGWDGIEHLASDHPLRRDAEPVRRSLDAMDAGDWAGAARLLAGVARRSPFAPWRLFCKAMGCFAAGDEHDLRRTVDLLPDDFALHGTVAELRRSATGAGPGGPEAVGRALGTRTAPVSDCAASLIQAIHAGAPHEIERRLVSLADAVYPEDPVLARIDLLMIACVATTQDALSMAALGRMIGGIVPLDRLEFVVAQSGLLMQELDGDLWEPDCARDYLELLPVAFPRRADQAMARSCVLESLARAGVGTGIGPHLLDPQAVEALTVLLGTRPEDPATMLVDLMMASLAADPESPTAYRFLLDLLRRPSVGSTGRVRSILEELAKSHPDDPDPWLEMVTLDYSRNAYRRAETALAEARRRAPYDERILDLQAAGFLKSADQSCKRGRFELAERDLERAANLRRRRLEPILGVKRLVLDVVRAGRNVAAAAAPHLRALPPGERLRTLAVAIHDLEENSNLSNPDPAAASALRRVLARGARAIKKLAPDEALGLIADLPSDYRVLYGTLRIAPVLSDWWGAVMARLDGDRLLACFDTLIACGGQKAVRAELYRRMPGNRAIRRDSLLQFYLAVVRYLEGADRHSLLFAEVLEAAEPGEHQRMRAAASRLAPVVDGPLRLALQRFDFDLLDHALPPLPAFLEKINRTPPPVGPAAIVSPEPREPEEPAEPESPVPELVAALRKAARDGRLDPSAQGLLFADEAIMAIVDRLETMIDGAELRGAPAEVMREVAGTARADPEMGRMLDELADWCTAGKRDVSPELAVMLFTTPTGAGAGKERS